MNMKQSCKALICAIEGELDGRHCTEEQAAAILDHALPSLTEALAQMEADRDTAIVQMQNIRKERDRINKELGDVSFNLCIAQQQLAEAVGLLEKVTSTTGWDHRDGPLLTLVHDFLVPHREAAFMKAKGARHAQAEQQEVVRTCSDERPCVNCFTNNGHCLGPNPQEAQGAQAGDETNIQAYQRGWDDRAALATQPAAGEPEPFIVGNQYRTQAGDLVRFVAVHNEGKSYETMEDESGVNRYTRRDFGRCTGTAHDYSDPRNTPPLWTAPPAAAHGDEAVRKDAERYRWLIRQLAFVRNESDEKGTRLFSLVFKFPVEEWRDCVADIKAAAMRAQGDGEVK